MGAFLFKDVMTQCFERASAITADSSAGPASASPETSENCRPLTDSKASDQNNSRIVLPASQQSSLASRKAFFDPAVQPMLANANLPSLPAACLQADYIQQAFSRVLPWQVEPLFRDAFFVDPAQQAAARAAAVLVPLVRRAGALHVVFTRRADHLLHHAGQVSFPGGCIEMADHGPVAAALRETHEEIGIAADFVSVMGQHPALLTTTRFYMTPVVGELLPGFQIRPDGSEVAEVFEVPLGYLLNPAHHQLRQIPSSLGHGRYFFAIPWRSYFIWGATAILVRNLYHFLAASATVDDLWP